MKDSTTYKCPCPEKKHTIDISKKEWAIVHSIIKEQGERIVVALANGNSYSVPRIYIARHGLKAQDIKQAKFPTMDQISKKAKKLAMKDANKEDIQTTSEGRSFLSARYSYWFKKLSRG